MARSAVTARQLSNIGMEIGVTGLPVIFQNIDRKVDQMNGRQAKRVWMRAALMIVREIRDNIHSISGRLYSAVFAAYGRRDKSNVVVGVSYGGGGKAPHAWVVEYGHGGPHPAGPHGYFGPGTLAARPMAGAMIIEGMREIAKS